MTMKRTLTIPGLPEDVYTITESVAGSVTRYIPRFRGGFFTEVPANGKGSRIAAADSFEGAVKIIHEFLGRMQ